MKRGNTVAIYCVAGCVLVLCALSVRADTIGIQGAHPNPVQQGQTLLVDLEVGNDINGPVTCPLTLTAQGGTTPLVSIPAGVWPLQQTLTIPDTAPSGTYILQWTCGSNGPSSAPMTVTIGSQSPAQIYQIGLLQPSGSDQTIGGVWFSNTEGNGYISYVSTQNPNNAFKVSSATSPGVTSWSENTIQYTLPIVQPGPYQVTVVRNNGGSSQPVTVQITPSVLQGWVDLHTHPLANLASGGKLFYGNVDYDPTNPLYS